MALTAPDMPTLIRECPICYLAVKAAPDYLVQYGRLEYRDMQPCACGRTTGWVTGRRKKVAK